MEYIRRDVIVQWAELIAFLSWCYENSEIDIPVYSCNFLYCSILLV